MRDVLDEIRAWHAAGDRFALATVVRTWRSAPRQPGAALAVSAAGEVVGSVSGGCVEGAVYELAQQVLADGDPVLQTYGVSDDDAFAVGLTCGGEITLLIRPVTAGSDPAFGAVAGSVAAGAGIAAVTWMRSWQDFDILNLAILPMFLFSATFFPLSTYPDWLEVVIQLTPLYHGVERPAQRALNRLFDRRLSRRAVLSAAE